MFFVTSNTPPSFGLFYLRPAFALRSIMNREGEPTVPIAA